MISSPLFKRSNFGGFEQFVNLLMVAFVFFIPFTKIGIPALGAYEMTFGDILMLLLSGFFFLVNHPIRKCFQAFLIALLMFILLVHLSIVSTINYYKFLLSSIPHFFSLTIVYIVFCYFSGKGFIYKIRGIRNTMIFSLLLSSLPVYYQLITGNKAVLFYDDWGWRYTFLSQNPNQYGVYFILFLILVTLITIKFFKKELLSIFLFELIFLVPALFSGSRTATLVYFLNIVVMLFLLFYYSSVSRRIVLSSIILTISIAMTPALISAFSSTKGQIARALNIFDKLSSNDKFEIGGATGDSIDEGWILFYKNPIIGVGLGNKTALIGRHEVHNTYVKYLCESGLIGFFGFSLIFLIPIVIIIGSNAELAFKIVSFIFYGLFALMNVPHMLYRQRWVWLFLAILPVLFYWDKNGNRIRSNFKFLN